jgi:hypothetical protein
VYTLFNGDVCNKECSLDSAVQVVQESNKSNNGFLCLMGSKCDTRSLVSFTGILAAFMATMTSHISKHNVNRFYDACDTSNNHTIRALDELGGGDGGTTSHAKSNGFMGLCCAMSAVCLVYLMWLIDIAFIVGLRYVCLEIVKCF